MGHQRKDLFIILALGLVFITLPLFFERLHSDEVIFWEIAGNLSEGKGFRSGTSGWDSPIHPPLPFIINSFFLLLSPHIFTSRAVSSLFVIGSALLIYLISVRKTGRIESLISSCLFLFSFQTLRYGGRFYLDQYGIFFFLLSFYSGLRGKPFSSGLFLLAAALSREYWLLAFPFIMLNAGDGLRERLAASSPLAVAFVAGAFLMSSRGGSFLTAAFSSDGAVFKNLLASINGIVSRGYIPLLIKAWAEFLVLNALALAGFISWAVSEKTSFSRRYLLLLIPLSISLSLTHGFILDGGVTQYGASLAASLAPFSGGGLYIIWKRVAARIKREESPGYFKAAATAVIALQFLFFNAFSSLVSVHKNLGIYSLGWRDDELVIGILREKARGQFISGIHGAFVEDRKGWDWTGYRLKEAIQKEPDWLVTFADYVEVLPEKGWKERAELYKIGPYLVLHSIERGGITEMIRPRESLKWRYGGPITEETRRPGGG